MHRVVSGARVSPVKVLNLKVSVCAHGLVHGIRKRHTGGAPRISGAVGSFRESGARPTHAALGETISKTRIYNRHVGIVFM